jgi:hippurate hydrolase
VDAELEPLRKEARALLPGAIELRRRIHRQPELGLVLPETQKAVLEALADLDLEIHTGGATSAVVAVLRGARPGPTLLLRADMDALPMQEDTNLPFRSERDGAMHACGHDAHVAMLVGAARLLAARRETLAGTRKFLFQPGEEGFAGARVLIGEGLLEQEPKVDAAFAIHVDSSLPAGLVATRPGPLMAAGDLFSIEVIGKGGHAAQPHLARDPIPVACEIVMALQAMVTRQIHAFDPAVLSVTKITAGSTGNVIPEKAHLLGTIRTVSEAARRSAQERLERTVRGIAAAHGLEVSLHVVPGYPVTVNHEAFTGFAREVAADLLGAERVVPMPTPVMGAEDFSYVLQRVPGAMVFLGARTEGSGGAPLHSNRMVIDESALADGIALHAALALRYPAAAPLVGSTASPAPGAPGLAPR